MCVCEREMVRKKEGESERDRQNLLRGKVMRRMRWCSVREFSERKNGRDRVYVSERESVCM